MMNHSLPVKVNEASLTRFIVITVTKELVINITINVE